ncbi:MAG: EthD domain-containing protein [Rhodospirillales bacterium]|nr:EthD domain-containing protein [Rhodospirillales bacterium]
MKIVFCLTRLSSLSPEAFRDYWLNVHAPLVRRHRKVLRIARYVQTHTLADGMSDKLRVFRSSPEPFDGVAEIWYESAAALESLGRDPDARAASRELREDEARFVDLARSPIWIGEERAIF